MIRYIIIALAVALFLVVIVRINSQKLSNIAKLFLAVLLLLAGAAAYWYEHRADELSAKRRALLEVFDSGGVLECGVLLVKKDKFNYEYGTASFVPKQSKRGFSGSIINIDGCVVAKDPVQSSKTKEDSKDTLLPNETDPKQTPIIPRRSRVASLSLKKGASA